MLVIGKYSMIILPESKVLSELFLTLKKNETLFGIRLCEIHCFEPRESSILNILNKWWKTSILSS